MEFVLGEEEGTKIQFDANKSQIMSIAVILLRQIYLDSLGHVCMPLKLIPIAAAN